MSCNPDARGESTGLDLLELERCLEREASLLGSGNIVVFETQAARVVVAAEVNPSLCALLKADALAEALGEAVRAGSAHAAWVLLAEAGALPRTSTGSLDRVACERRFRGGTLPAYATYRDGQRVDAPALAASGARRSDGAAPRDEVEEALRALWRESFPGGPVDEELGFFALGGSSVDAARLVARVQERLGIALELGALYQAPSLRGLVGQVRRAQLSEGAAARAVIARAPRTEPLPLSGAQRRMHFLWQLDPEGAAYNICGALRLEGALDLPALQRSFERLGARHESLRTRFPELAGEVVQQIEAALPVEIPVDDLSAAADRDRSVRERISAEACRAFDLERGPLWRVRLVRLGREDHVLAVTLHHAIADGASMDVLVADLAALYAAECAGATARLPALPIQYADYARWQAERLASGEEARQLAYWTGELQGDPSPLALPRDRARPALPTQRGGQLEFELDEELCRRVRATAREHEASVFMLLLAVFDVLLQRYTRQADVRVGVPAANRLRFEAERVVGAFVNTTVLRVSVSERATFSDLLAQVKRAALAAQRHQELPFEKLVEALQPERNAAYHPLFQVMFNHQQRDLAALSLLPGLQVSVWSVPLPVTRFDLSLNTEEDGRGCIRAALVYATDLFDAKRIERLARHYRQLLAALLDAPDRPIAAAPWLLREELERLESWSVPVPFAPPDGSVFEWIEARARRAPEAPALVFGDRALSYGALDRHADSVARALTARGAGPDAVVGLLAERSLELVVGLLAIAKAGAAFLPLDPEYPTPRIGYLIEDSRARLVLAPAALRARLPLQCGVEIVDLGALGEAPPEPPADALPLARRAPPSSLAYVLYTSGSTGRPKAVGNTRGALAERLAWMQREYQVSAGETWLHKTPLSFDVAVWEVFLPLMSGARVVIAPPGDHKDPHELALLIQRHGVCAVHFVPSLLREFVADQASAGCTSLRRVFSGGETLPPELARDVLERFPGARVDNRYGPTEALINASCWTCRAGDSGPVPIGAPIPNGALRIVDPSLGALPEGVVGELCIAGGALARGYLGRPSLTAERFVPDPFGGTGARLYRSGDLARFRGDGAIEFLGRQDQQVKIRGVRIELGEVESALLAEPGVRAAAALAVPGPGGGVFLVAWLVADAALESAVLERRLADRLPAQLVPARIVRLDVLPLLPNGKLARQALPLPEWREAAHQAPEGDVQRRVARIWEEVLGAPRVGQSDDFFALGGHSLLATRVVARVRREFDVELPLRDLFEARGLSSFAARVECAIAAGRRLRQPPLEPVDRSRPLPLSYAQERMWFLWSLDPLSAAYNVGGSVRLKGPLNGPALAAGLAELQARHEALRTTFPRLDGAPEQRIHARGSVAIEIVDLSALSEEERPSEQARRASLEAHLPFDLEQGPLFRVTLYRMSAERHVLVVTLHHVIAEGWAMDVFAREYAALYAAFCDGRPSPLEPLAVQYAEYGAWQRRWLESGERDRQLDFWRRTLGDEHPVLELPADRPRPSVQSFRGDYHRFQLERPLIEKLRAYMLARGVTLSMTLTGALFALLYRYSGQRSLRVGYPVANRSRPEFEGLIGAFLNTQVLACEVHADLSAVELIERVRSASIDAQSHQDVPFHHIVEALAPERSAAHTPLFQVMCNVQSWQFRERRRVGNLELEFVENDARAAQFELTLDASEFEDTIECAFSYSLDRFDRESVERMASHWVRLLDAMLSDGSTPVAGLALLGDAELDSIRRASLGPVTRSHGEACLHQLVERQAALAPDAIAVVSERGSLSYAELEARANQLAHGLRARGIGPEARVGVCAERGLEAVVSLLGILKAGGAYLPIDPEYPAERRRHLLRDGGARLLLVSAGAAIGTDEPGVPVWELEQDASNLREYPVAPVSNLTHPENVAYCIYTSGSTGRPKGVASSHRGLVNRLAWLQSEHALGPSDKLLGKTSCGFDVSVGELLWPLVCGAQLVLAPPGAERDPAELGAVIRRHGITTADFVPALLQAFLTAGELDTCASLRLVTVGGEVLPCELERSFVARHGARLYNMYGPTEASIDVAFQRCGADERRSSVPIGSPMANVELHVLDARLEPVPPLVTGELYIGGVALARGYLGRPGETALRFVPHPAARGAGERLYRTGDLVRRRADGPLEFVGRADSQVKLRGYRIELGEIEAQLLEHPSVREAVVSLRATPTGPQLVAHVAGGVGVDAAVFGRELRLHLARTLPKHMIPAWIVALERLPRQPSGKLDSSALPAPELPDAERHVAAETDIERRLAAIWRDVLGLERVGVEDNFFELGGDSIVSLQVVHRAREQGLPLSARDLFQHQTVRALAAAVPAEGSRVEPDGPASGDVPLTPIQCRFLAEEMPERDHYNQALLLRPRAQLDADALGWAFSQLVAHHDALGLRYQKDARGRWHQQYPERAAADGEPALGLLWTRHADSAEALQRVCDSAQRSLDIERGPLLRAVLIDLADRSQRLLIVVHHLVIDGVSWRVLLADLELAYRGLSAGASPRLPPKTSSFKRWAERLVELAASESQAAERDYWLAQTDRPAPRELPRDDARGGLLVGQRATVSFELGVERTSQLLRAAPEAYRTQVNDLLLVALARVLCRYGAETCVWIELESHGRQDLDGFDLSRSVGWFTSAYPVLLSPELGPDPQSLGSAILSVKEALRAVPRGGLGYGAFAELGAQDVRARLASGPRPRVTFNYLGQFDPSFRRDALFELASESPGPTQSELAPLGNWLGVEGRVSGGRLGVSFAYSREMYRAQTIERLAADHQQELEALIEHCTSVPAGGVSPSDFPLIALSQGELDQLAVAPRQISDIYPLSAMQEGLLFHAAYSPGEDLYVCQLSADVVGLDRDRFERAWQAVVDRHEVLRTSFHERPQGKGFMQLVHRSARAIVREVDGREPALDESELERLAREERAARFELGRPPLLRLLLVRTRKGHRFIWTHHHVLMDGWSSARLLEEVLRIYAGELAPAKLGAYRDYIAWLRERDTALDERFWKERLSSLGEPTLLASSVARPITGTGRAEHVRALSRETTARLQAFAREGRITLSTLVQAAWLLLLQRYTGQRRVVLGATVAGRPANLRGAESMLGLFINTLPVIASPDPAREVGDWLRELQARNVELGAHEHTPLAEIQRWAGHAGQALFDTLVVFENYPLDQALRAGGLGELRFDHVASFDLTNYALSLLVKLGDRLRFVCDYARAAFDAEQVATLSAELERLLSELVIDPRARLGALAAASPARLAALASYNATERRWPVPQLVHECIERQCELTPAAVAAVYGAEALTYSALNARANRLAHWLRSIGVGPDVLVGVCLERSLDLLVALLAILKAGGAYVPLDPDYPLERLSFMLADSGLTLLVTERRVLAGRPAPGVPAWCIDTDGAVAAAFPSTNPVSLARPEHLAYCIYTSGSTGQPKGVEVSHASLVNFLASMREAPGVTPQDRVLALTSLSFDISALELYLPLCAGGRVVLVDRATARDPRALERAIEDHAVTLIQATPSTWRALVESGATQRLSARRVLSGGEALPLDLAQHLAAWASELWNVYGPTETTVWSSSHRLTSEAPEPLLGQPLANTALHALGAALDPAPAGAAAELFIGGEGLARGYHGRPALTAERFLPDPFARAPGARMYRTGDLVRRRPDGRVEYLGRLDHQVKIRGHRIELGEIEARLLEDGAVRQAVVVAQPGTSGLELTGYVVAHAASSEEESSALIARLTRELRAALPAYMLPSELILLEALPLTANGKIDRRALPRGGRAAAQYVPPHTELGRELARIWQEVLGVERVGVNDGFFSLGGHSLLATRVISRIHAELSLDVPLRSLFETQSLEQFERAVRGSSKVLDVEDLLFVSELLAREEA